MVERHLAPIRVRDDPGKDNPAPYREPVELACFSKSRAHGTTYDKSMLKQYLRPSVPFDLSVGYSTFVDRDRGVQRPALLDPIFGALRHANVLEKELACADVVTWRGNFAKLLATPWNTRDPWHMECERVDGVLVLNVLEPTQLLEKERKKDKQGREAKMCYWGFSFEERCVGGAGAYGEPIDCANCFCAVVRAGVGAHRLVLGGEVDCWDGEKHGLAGYVELKTTRVMDTQGQVKNFERDKLLKWWAQSFAVGVRRILVGFRDDSGHVQKLQTLDTLKLPGYAARHNGTASWAFQNPDTLFTAPA
jgi:RAT1-interacting protein